MYQKFTVTSSPETGAPRLKRLRAELTKQNLNGFLIPRADAHRGEDVAACDQRLAWLTGFTGSDGHCVALTDSAAVFVDGRYRLQVRNQVDTAIFAPMAIPQDTLSDWLISQLPDGGVVGYDPMLHSFDEVQKLDDSLKPHNITLQKTRNLIDTVWEEQPTPPTGKITVHPLEFAGQSSDEKRNQITKTLSENGLVAAVLTLPASIAWLLNIRGSDIATTPIALAFAIIHADASVDLIVDPAKCDPQVISHLGHETRIIQPKNFSTTLAALNGPVGVDRTTAPVWISDQLTQPEWFSDPCILPKAIKNPVELDGTRRAHLRDGAAMCEFLAWVDRAIPGGDKTEIDVVQKLEQFRRNTNALTGISFETISGSGPNGAIVHYRVDDDSNRTIQPDELLLVDSGGQYLDGTTDITRTVIIGTPTAKMIRSFTLVLKGMIGISMLRWPDGKSGKDIDAIARMALWQAGYDYDHGTGHGVGSYLGVHEGPQAISPRSTVPIEAGMILSNEPGVYFDGEWGIRIENLVIVDPPAIPHNGDREMLGFETITWVPIDRRLVDRTLLSTEEHDWLDGYHAMVLDYIGPLVSPKTQVWLTAACAPI